MSSASGAHLASTHSIINLWRFLKHLSKGSQDTELSLGDLDNAIAKIDRGSWAVLSEIVRSQATRDEGTPLAIFEETFCSLGVLGKMKVYAHIIRPLLCDELSSVPQGRTVQSRRITLSVIFKPLGDLLVHFSRSYRLHDYQLLEHYVISVISSDNSVQNCPSTQTDIIDTLFTFIDALPPGNHLQEILIALNQESAKGILQSVHNANDRLLVVDSSMSREDLAESTTLNKLYGLMVNSPKDTEAMSALKLAYRSSDHNAYFQNATVHSVVHLLFGILYDSIRPIGGSAVVKSIVQENHATTRRFWMNILFCFLPSIPLNSRSAIAVSLEALFRAYPLALPDDAPVPKTRKTPIKPKAKVQVKVQKKEMICERPFQRTEVMVDGVSRRPQRQSAQHVHLLTHHIHQDFTAEWPERRQNVTSSAPCREIPERNIKEYNGKRLHLRIAPRVMIHDSFSVHIEFIKRHGFLYDLLCFHAEKSRVPHGNVVCLSWKSFCNQHGFPEEKSLLPLGG